MKQEAKKYKVDNLRSILGVCVVVEWMQQCYNLLCSP